MAVLCCVLTDLCHHVFCHSSLCKIQTISSFTLIAVGISVSDISVKIIYFNMKKQVHPDTWLLSARMLTLTAV